MTAVLLQNLKEIERSREAYWRRYPATSPTRLRWRANATRHALHIAPGETVLELGAGSGVWTEHLTSVLRGESAITAAVFNSDLADAARGRALPATDVVNVTDQDMLAPESYDYVVGTAMLSHNRWQENLAWIVRLLKPGGQLLFLEANYWNPQVFAKAHSRRLARWSRNAECQIALRESEIRLAARSENLEEVVVVPYDILHPRTPKRLVPAVQSTAFVLEHLPGIQELCGTLFICAGKPRQASMERPRTDLARHESLTDSVSIVVPCHNEAMNIPRLVRALTATYDKYIHEIVLVNDNSEDDTAHVARKLAESDARIRLVDRSPPPGVGRALRDGYAVTTGKYILTMDCDFEMLVPELQDLFDVIAAGHEGAIGSRFSHQSVLLNYPAAKLIGNRAFHLIIRLFLRRKVRDISNNLKLYRGDILREMNITQDGFAANAETGLRPLLEGRDIKEVPIAWINRSSDMGVSTFRVARVAPGYAMALIRMLAGYIRADRPAAAPDLEKIDHHVESPQTERADDELSSSSQGR
jgi:2-polyprenyl-3-methyl-5-hydroxy-6-metoxy-1,4-benzoquinol methylase